jgi:hypothetical protein
MGKDQRDTPISVYEKGQCPNCFSKDTWNGRRCSACGAQSS